MGQCFLTWLQFILVTLPLLHWTHGPDGSDWEALGGGTVLVPSVEIGIVHFEGRFVPLLRRGKEVGLLNLT